MPAASQYLRALEARGLLTCRRVGRRVNYGPTTGTSEGAAGEIVKALRVSFRRAQPIDAIFKFGHSLHPPATDRGVSQCGNRRGFVCKTSNDDANPCASPFPASQKTGSEGLGEE